MSDHDDPKGTADRDRGGPPKPKLLRIVLAVVLIAVAIVVLFTWVFPWVESIQQDPTIGAVAALRSGLGPALR